MSLDFIVKVLITALMFCGCMVVFYALRILRTLKHLSSLIEGKYAKDNSDSRE